MRVALGADHAGEALKHGMERLLERLAVPYEDFGTFGDEPDTSSAGGRHERRARKVDALHAAALHPVHG